jgi:hypothetical protein
MESTIALRVPEDLRKKIEKKRSEMARQLKQRVTLSMAVRLILAEALT